MKITFGDKSKSLLKTFFAAIIVTCTIVIVLKISSVLNYNHDCAALGVQAVKAMYNFSSPEELDYQMYSLQQITTDDIFNQLTIDNTNRTLSTYLKFKSKPVTVHVIESESNYVIYSLETENVSENRKFVFFFHVNTRGLIDKVEEVEAIDFVQDYSKNN